MVVFVWIVVVVVLWRLDERMMVDDVGVVETCCGWWLLYWLVAWLVC